MRQSTPPTLVAGDRLAQLQRSWSLDVEHENDPRVFEAQDLRTIEQWLPEALLAKEFECEGAESPSRARLVQAAWPALRSSPDRHSVHHFQTTPGDLLEAVFDLQPYAAVTDSSREPIASSGSALQSTSYSEGCNAANRFIFATRATTKPMSSS